MTEMIKNIVFDIGGVLADYRMKEFLLEKGIVSFRVGKTKPYA